MKPDDVFAVAAILLLVALDLWITRGKPRRKRARRRA